MIASEKSPHGTGGCGFAIRLKKKYLSISLGAYPPIVWYGLKRRSEGAARRETISYVEEKTTRIDPLRVTQG